MYNFFIVFPFFIILLNNFVSAGPIIDSANSVVAIEVPVGKNVILNCTSNGVGYNFMFWRVQNTNQIIGPSNDFDISKYGYEILSGNLTVKAVTKNDQGVYDCVSRALHTDKICIRAVQLTVDRDWEQINETDPTVNSFRLVIVIFSVILICGILYYAYKIWKDRYRYPSYIGQSEDEDEDSTEEIFIAPSTSGSTRGKSSSNNMTKSQKDEGFENPAISTDFSSILDTANNK